MHGRPALQGGCRRELGSHSAADRQRRCIREHCSFRLRVGSSVHSLGPRTGPTIPSLVRSHPTTPPPKRYPCQPPPAPSDSCAPTPHSPPWQRLSATKGLWRRIDSSATVLGSTRRPRFPGCAPVSYILLGGHPEWTPGRRVRFALPTVVGVGRCPMTWSDADVQSACGKR